MHDFDRLRDEIINLIEHANMPPIDRVLMFDAYISILGIRAMPDNQRRPERPLLQGAP